MKAQVSMEFLLTTGMLMVMFIGVLTLSFSQRQDVFDYDRLQTYRIPCERVANMIQNVHALGDGARLKGVVDTKISVLGGDMRNIIAWYADDAGNYSYFCRHGVFNVTNGFVSTFSIPARQEFIVENVKGRVEVRDASLEEGLIAWLRMDGDARDSSWNGMHGSCTSCPDFVSSPFGKSGVFDGATTNLSVTGIELKDYQQKAISFWFKPNFTSGKVRLISDEVSVDNGSFFITFNYSSSVVSFSSGIESISSSASIDNWHHVYAAINHNDMRFYINGSLVGNTSFSSSSSGTDFIKIGYRESNTGVFNGLIDDVRIYNRALSSEEVAQLYDSYFSLIERKGDVIYVD